MTRALLVAAVLVVACRSNSSNNGADAPINTGGDGGSGGGGDAPAGSSGNGCGSYTASSIASMRQGATSGCYELDDVTLNALTSSSTSPGMFLQDAGDGSAAYSAVKTTCESDSTTHPCSIGATVSAFTVGDAVTVKGLYTVSSSGFEAFYVDSATAGAAATVLMNTSAALTDMERDSTSKALLFQHLRVTLGSTTLKVYDWSPVEFAYTSATSCGDFQDEYQEGFALIGSNVAASGAACTDNTTQPASPGANNAEILVSTSPFKKTYTDIYTDCRCGSGSGSAGYADVPTATSTVTGTIGGFLLFDTLESSGSAYYYIDPDGSADLTMSNLTAI